MKIAGVKIEKYANGSIKKVTFDYKKHSNIIKPLLEKLSYFEEEDFDKRFKAGYTTDEAIKETQKRIRKWFK